MTRMWVAATRVIVVRWLSGMGSALVCVVMGTAACGPSNATEVWEGSLWCTLPPPTVLEADPEPSRIGSMILQRFDIPDDGRWEARGDPSGFGWLAARNAFHSLARTTEPVALLLGYPTANNVLVARHASVWLRAPTCLEKALLAVQNERLSFAAEPTEFVAFVLHASSIPRLRVWFYSINRNGSGSMRRFTEAMAPDLTAGWRILFSLHNHPFATDTAPWHGVPSPSGGDAQFYQEFSMTSALPEVRITNGFTTTRIPAPAIASLVRSDAPETETARGALLSSRWVGGLDLLQGPNGVRR